ncbi:hypothetical protein ACTHPH_00870 [Paenibacillus pasadenensis]|uniref:hypothetical protein n=1 Tax=Paenibacillus TaxID=44249 RepID=UPI0004D75C6D|nr:MULTISPECIES: hypothetical protein [Paenibacillus]MPY19514.1 hypothetical protein [Paenibacillus glucanolyticus]GAK43200.1 hypothetical protein TCA2_5695 [Paenibacillus sp. TCA20]GIP20651.1 hypothetical protein J22TS3_09260 [Paenibacillus sp. J22TS3]
MAITNAFINAVEAGNVRSIRIMMKDSLLVDPTFAEFNQMEQYARNINGLYDEHDGRELKEDKTSWNDDYMNKLMVQVVGNFSHDRISRLKEIVRHLRPVASNTPARHSNGNGISSVPGNSSSRMDVANNGNYPFRQPSSNSWRSSPPSSRQQQWIGKQNKRLRTTRVTTGALAGGVVVGTATAIGGGSFIAGAAVGAVVVGAAVFIATHRR